MNKLVKAGMFRLKKDRVYLGSIAIVSLFTLSIYAIVYYKMNNVQGEGSFDPIIFNFLIMIGIVTSIFVSSFVGTEYSDGTIRNKLILGFPRLGIYLSSLITCIIGEVIIVVIAYIVGIIVGIPLFGVPETNISNMLLAAINGVLISLTYVSIFHMISMISSSKTTSAIISILVAFGVMIGSVSIYSKLGEPKYINKMIQQNENPIIEKVENPYYLSGNKRDIYEAVLDVLPSGQAMKIINQHGENNGKMIIYSILVIGATSIVGSTLFLRKEIK